MPMTTMRVLFVSLTDDLGSDRLVSDMGRGGALCAVLGSTGCVASLPRCVDATFSLPGGFLAAFMLGRTLVRAVADWRPDKIVPLDDLAATLLRTVGRKARPFGHLHRVLRLSFGRSTTYPAACERVALMKAAELAGVRIPPFMPANVRPGRSSVETVPLPAMVKRDQSSGSGGVVRVETSRDLAQAIRRGWLKSAAKAVLAQLAGLGRPVTPVLIQSVVEGRLAMYTAVCREGRLIDGVGFTAIETHPLKRSSTILRHCAHPEMAEAARRIVASLSCSGFVSFDFIIDEKDRAFLIEMNARPIGSAHLGRRFGHDLVHAFLSGSAGGGMVEVAAEDIALFPKELERDPEGRRLDQGDVFHDLPTHEPAVVAAYLARLQAEHPGHADELARRCNTPAPPLTFPKLRAA